MSTVDVRSILDKIQSEGNRAVLDDISDAEAIRSGFQSRKEGK